MIPLWTLLIRLIACTEQQCAINVTTLDFEDGTLCIMAANMINSTQPYKNGQTQFAYCIRRKDAPLPKEKK